jgi:hypothetical protein
MKTRISPPGGSRSSTASPPSNQTSPTPANTGDSAEVDDNVDEQSPLLPPTRVLDNDGQDKSVSSLGDAEGYVEERNTRSSWYMFLLTLGAFG